MDTWDYYWSPFLPGQGGREDHQADVEGRGEHQAYVGGREDNQADVEGRVDYQACV